MDPGHKTFLVWGAGGHGKVIADLIRASGARVTGFADADVTKLGAEVEPRGGRVVVQENELLATIRERHCFPAGADAVALGVGENATRHNCLLMLSDLPVPALVHPRAVLSPSVVVGRGSTILAAAVVNASSHIGEAVIVNSGAIIEHDCRLADGAHISPGAILAGGVRVGKRTWVGAGAVVLPNVALGMDVVVGAGAVVTRDVPDRCTVIGVPARPVFEEN